jgi:arylsulfatase A-like enzyme
MLKALGAGAATLALPGLMRAAGQPQGERPNFIIILADDMGYGDSSCYGGWIKTPGLEALAAEGLKFTDFHASGSVCSPTRAGFLTGRYQQRAGVPGVINADPKHPSHAWGLDPAEITFPELLKAVGYTTAIFGKWHLGYDRKFNPMNHGFDRFRGYISGNIDYVSHYDRMGAYDWWEGLKQIKEDGYTTRLIADHSVKFIEEHKAQPFCLYVSHEAVHTPLQGPDDPALRGGPEAKKPTTRPRRSAKETYRLMMQEMDACVGRIVAAVKKAGIAQRTLIFFFSDNGAVPSLGSNAPLKGGKGSVWEGGHREPAIAWWPGRITPGRATDELAISLDLMPTMLALAGADVPHGHRLDGVSLADLLTAGKGLGPRRLFWDGRAMRDGPWKLVLEGQDTKSPRLYNLSKDIGEKKDLAGEQPQRVEKMLAAIEDWKKDVAGPRVQRASL